MIARLEADGLIQRQGDRYRTTRRWQGAMAERLCGSSKRATAKATYA